MDKHSRKHRHPNGDLPQVSQKASPSPTRERWLSWSALGLVLATYLGFSIWRITDFFVTISADTNGDSGVAVWNLLRYGPTALKFGLFTNWLTGSPATAAGLFYVHHPVGFLWPTYLFYLLFGPSELTTRLGPLACMTLSIPFFFFALRRVFQDRLRPILLILLTYVLLPGTIYYGKTFELSVFSLPAALITWSLFVLYRAHPTRSRFFWLLVSVLIGGTMGWFYYFLPAALWLILAFSARSLPTPRRITLLITLPLILAATFSLHLLHGYLLNGASAFTDIGEIFSYRVSRTIITFGQWLLRAWEISAANFNLVFLVLGLVGLGLLLRQIRKVPNSTERELIPLLLFPILNTIIFFQWSTHPFGLIFFLPTIAIGTGYLLDRFFQKSWRTGITLGLISLVFGITFTVVTLNDWNASLIWGRADIRALRELKPQIEKWDLCLGENTEGVSYTGLTAWYLERPVKVAPGCLSGLEHRAVAILFNPEFFQPHRDFYQKKIETFEKLGFQKFRCVTALCFYVRGDKAK